MTIYLKDIALSLAKERFQIALEKEGISNLLGYEEIPLDEHALNRILAKPIWAIISSPHYNASAMDGFAVNTENSISASATNQVKLSVPDQAEYVDTGDPLPAWANAVVPIENIEPLFSDSDLIKNPRKPKAIGLRISLTPWLHVRPMGEDVIASELVLPAGRKIKPADLGAMAASGNYVITVSRKPVVKIIPTGSELVQPGTKLFPGDIIEFNSIVLAAQVNLWGGFAIRTNIVPDQLEALSSAIQNAADTSDLVIINAGSSAGSEDFTASIIDELGEVLVHGIAVRPGHPVILGMLNRKDRERRIPVIGVPGYPVSAAMTGELFIRPLISSWLGTAYEKKIEIYATITRKITSTAGDDDFIRVVTGKVGKRTLAAPLARGAGIITSLAKADGLILIPSGEQGLDANSLVKVELFDNNLSLEKTIFSIGSHDLTLDLLGQALTKYDRRLVSVNAGSQGGLSCLGRGEAHFSGIHLLDPKTGIYNIAAINEYLPGADISILKWVEREQGLIVRKGNPKKILKLEDLNRDDIVFVNRQKGSGTRLLLDYQLALSGITPTGIKGYFLEEYTHLAVAAAISSGRADCGLGISAAANALDLTFIPLYAEEYDLAVPREFLNSELLIPIFKIIDEKDFQAAINRLGGYRIPRIGEIVHL